MIIFCDYVNKPPEWTCYFCFQCLQSVVFTIFSGYHSGKGDYINNIIMNICNSGKVQCMNVHQIYPMSSHSEFQPIMLNRHKKCVLLGDAY